MPLRSRHLSISHGHASHICLSHVIEKKTGTDKLILFVLVGAETYVPENDKL